jgi:hypothetical protein
VRERERESNNLWKIIKDIAKRKMWWRRSNANIIIVVLYRLKLIN